MTNRLHGIVVMAAAVAIAAGCKGGSKLNTVPVTVKVTLDGAPLADATVSFLSESQTDAVSSTAFGKTDAEGVCKLQTLDGSKMAEGAKPGKYQVTIAKMVSGGGGVSMGDKMAGQAKGNADTMELSDEDRNKISHQGENVTGEGGVGGTTAKNDVPAKYGKPADSGLTAEVKASGAQSFEFPLKSNE